MGDRSTYPTCFSPREVIEAVVSSPGVIVDVEFSRHVERQSSSVIHRIVDRAVLGTSHPNEASQVLFQTPFGSYLTRKVFHLRETKVKLQNPKRN